MHEDLAADSIYWAKDLLSVEPDNADAHYVLAVEAVEGRTPNVPEARRHLEVLEAKNAPLMRRLWVRAKLAEAAGDHQAQSEAVEQAQKAELPPEADPVDRMTKLRIICLGVEAETEPSRLKHLIRCLHDQVAEFGQTQRLAPARVARVRALLEPAQRALLRRAAKLAGPDKKAFDALVECDRCRPRIDLQARHGRRAGARSPDILELRRPLAVPPSSATAAWRSSTRPSSRRRPRGAPRPRW